MALGDRQWLLTEHRDMEARLGLVSVGMEVAIADRYENIVLEGDAEGGDRSGDRILTSGQ